MSFDTDLLCFVSRAEISSRDRSKEWDHSWSGCSTQRWYWIEWRPWQSTGHQRGRLQGYSAGRYDPADPIRVSIAQQESDWETYNSEFCTTLKPWLVASSNSSITAIFAEYVAGSVVMLWVNTYSFCDPCVCLPCRWCRELQRGSRYSANKGTEGGKGRQLCRFQYSCTEACGSL